MRKIILYTIFAFISLLCLTEELFAQDPNFSQFYNNPTYYNPAMNAIGNGFTFRLNGRSLWTPIPGKFNTCSASFEAEAVNKTSFGVLGFSDVAGTANLRTNGGYLYYAYRPIETKNFILQGGFSGGLISKTLDVSKLVFSDQLDEVYGNVKTSAYNIPNNSVLYPDFSTGIAMRFNKISNRQSLYKKMMITLGSGLHHLTKPRDAFISDNNRLPMKFVVHGSVNVLVNNLIFAPSFIFEHQNKFETFTLGMNVINKPFTFGFWYRNRSYTTSFTKFDSFIFSAGTVVPMKNGSDMRIMYSFDMTISRLKTSSYGSNEISLIFDFDDHVLFRKLQRKNKNKRMYQCPTDFNGL